MPEPWRDPATWGPPFWKTLHYIAHSYPDNPSEDIRGSMLSLLSSMAVLLPCPVCQSHCVEYFCLHPPAVESRQALIEYLWKFHNSVNVRTGKPELTLREALRQIERKTYTLPTGPEVDQTTGSTYNKHQHKPRHSCTRKK